MIDNFHGHEYRWLSNFWPATVRVHIPELGQVTFPSVENAYQALKCRWARDVPYFQTCTAGQAKRRGHQVELNPHHRALRLFIMEDLLSQKFSTEPLRSMLMATHPQELVEGNTWGDTYWGVCRGQGQNHLGLLLMKVRQQLLTDEDQTASLLRSLDHDSIEYLLKEEQDAADD